MQRISDGGRGTLVGKGGRAYRRGTLNTAGTIMLLGTMSTMIISDILAIPRFCPILTCFRPKWLLFGLVCMLMYLSVLVVHFCMALRGV